MESIHIGPFNLGNPGEFTMLELAQVCPYTGINYPFFFENTSYSCPQFTYQESWHCTISLQVVKETIDPGASVEFKPNTADDPHMRKPDISKAKSLLNWEPKISLKQGLPRMVSDFQKRIMEEKWGAEADGLGILYHTDWSFFGALTKLRWRTTCLRFLPPGQILFCDRTSVLWFRYCRYINFAIELHVQVVIKAVAIVGT